MESLSLNQISSLKPVDELNAEDWEQKNRIDKAMISAYALIPDEISAGFTHIVASELEADFIKDVSTLYPNLVSKLNVTGAFHPSTKAKRYMRFVTRSSCRPANMAMVVNTPVDLGNFLIWTLDARYSGQDLLRRVKTPFLFIANKFTTDRIKRCIDQERTAASFRKKIKKCSKTKFTHAQFKIAPHAPAPSLEPSQPPKFKTDEQLAEKFYKRVGQGLTYHQLLLENKNNGRHLRILLGLKEKLLELAFDLQEAERNLS